MPHEGKKDSPSTHNPVARGLHYTKIGALIIRIGFGAHYTILGNH